MSRALAAAVTIAVLTLSLLGGGCHFGSFADAATTRIEAVGNCFEPTVARIEVGDRVRWTNADAFAHTVTGAAGMFDTGDFGPGDLTSWTFTQAGVYPYSCLLHPGMVGAIVVGGGGSGQAASGAEEDAGAPSGDGPIGAGRAWAPALAATAGVLGLGMALVLRRRRVASAL
jgi:plastocyanin